MEVDVDMFLHSLAVHLASEAEQELDLNEYDPEEDLILHLGETFVATLRGLAGVRRKMREAQQNKSEKEK